MSIPRLTDDQVSVFENTWLLELRGEAIKGELQRLFGDRPFTVLDVGGGAGFMADFYLKNFPAAQVTLLDNSDYLLKRNAPHPNKHLINGSALDAGDLLKGRTFDLINIHMLFHHLVGMSYAASIRQIQGCLTGLGTLLAPASTSRICLIEQFYDGLFFDNLPGWLIYQLTSSRVLAGVVRKAGANTAGCGVCFQSEKAWRSHIAKAGLDVELSVPGIPCPRGMVKRLILHCPRLREAGVLWLRRMDSDK